MGDLTRAIAKPVLLWALHFTAIYALISAAYAPRALLAPAHLVVTAAGLTALAAVLQILWIWRLSDRDRRNALGPDARALQHAAWWSGLISLIATLANLTPVLILPGCHG
jgi:membrane-associated protease RseP (regulator of RpoE activity)